MSSLLPAAAGGNRRSVVTLPEYDRTPASRATLARSRRPDFWSRNALVAETRGYPATAAARPGWSGLAWAASHFLTTSVALGLLLVSAPLVRAEVSCPPVFSDHMVLQRDRTAPVWGDAAPGESVTVEFAGQHQTTTADATGNWGIALAPLPASAEPRTLTIRGADRTLTFHDVLVGEVWFCSGQSNMEKPLGPRKGQKPTSDYEAELTRAACPTLRLFQEPHSGKAKPDSVMMRWLACDADALTNTNFSAAAYYFGRELVRELGVPVGLIHSSFGGTRIETWMPPAAFASDPALRDLETVRYEAPTGTQATELYTRMVAPFVPFAVRGFLWYQGETNCMDGDGSIYANKLRALVKTWRAAWHEPDVPFYSTLIAPFTYSTRKNAHVFVSAEELPLIWEAQIAALSLPHTGIVSTTDIAGSMRDIHPTDKRDVGLRWAKLALSDTYGRHDLLARSPQFTAANWLPGKAEIVFTEAAGLHSRDGQPLNEFTIAGDDHTFAPATATLLPNGHIEVSSPAVSHPVAVRFAWHETANPNLVNAAGLPALPFRTDRWPITTIVPPAPAESPAPPHETAAHPAPPLSVRPDADRPLGAPQSSTSLDK